MSRALAFGVTESPPPAHCGACDAWLTSTDPRARYCSNACRQQAHRNRRGTRNPGSPRFALLRYLIAAGALDRIVALEIEEAAYQLRNGPGNVAAALWRLTREEFAYAKRDPHGWGRYSVRLTNLPRTFRP